MIKAILTRVHISIALANVDNVNGVTQPGIISLKKEMKENKSNDTILSILNHKINPSVFQMSQIRY